MGIIELSMIWFRKKNRMQKATRGFLRAVIKAHTMNPRMIKIETPVVHGVNREVERM